MKKIVNGIEVDLTQSELDQIEIDRLAQEADDAAYGYIRKRLLAYPTIGDQLDMIFNNGLDYWKEQIQIIKDLYPKP